MVAVSVCVFASFISCSHVALVALIDSTTSLASLGIATAARWLLVFWTAVFVLRQEIRRLFFHGFPRSPAYASHEPSITEATGALNP